MTGKPKSVAMPKKAMPSSKHAYTRRGFRLGGIIRGNAALPKLDRAQPQEKGRHRSCTAPLLEAALYRACASRGASAECQSKTTGSRPWLKLYRRSAAEMRQSPVGYFQSCPPTSA